MYGCFTWGRLTLHSTPSIWPNLYSCVAENSTELPGRPWNFGSLCTLQQNLKPKSQSNVPLGHPYWIFMCIKLLDRDEEFATTLMWWISLTFSLSFYLFALVVIVPDSFLCLFCVVVQPRRCDSAIVALPWQPFWHLSQNCLCSCELEAFCGRQALKSRHCCIFVKSRTGLGLINCFYCCVSRGLFLYTVCENVFISLDYYNGF